MVKRFHNTCLAAVTIGLLLVATPARSQGVPLIHVDNTTVSTVTGAINSYTAYMMKGIEFVNSTNELIAKGVSGVLDTVISTVTDAIGDGLSYVKDAVGLGEGGALTNMIDKAGNYLSSAGDAIQSGLSGAGERMGEMMDTSGATDMLANIPGASFVSGMLGGGANSISGVIGNWGTEAAPKISLTASTGIPTNNSNDIISALTFQSDKVKMEDIHTVRATYNAMAGDIATTVISSSAAHIQSATDYDKTVDSRTKGAVPKTTLEIAQESETEREDLKNMNGTTATWLAMSNAALTMDVDRIALEAGTTLQDSVSSTNPVLGIFNGLSGLGGLGGAMGSISLGI